MFASWEHKVWTAAAAMALWLLSFACSEAAELVMYRRDGCPFCARFEREVAPIYSKTREGTLAPLKRIDLPTGGVRDGSLREPVIGTPTFVLVDAGREIGRITGYLNDDTFWGLLGQLLAGMDKHEGNPKP